jgi:hypothetical protein
LIAEAVLTDSDNALAEHVSFTRFVGDFRIFLRPHQSAYATLAFFADQLAASEGLSLNADKTRVYSASDFHSFIENQLVDAFEEGDENAMNALRDAVYFDEDISDEDVSKVLALNLLEMLEAELSSDVWDFGRIKAVFRGLRSAPDPNSIEYINNNLQSLLPFIKELVLYLHSLNDNYEINTSVLLDKIWTELNTGAAWSVPTIRVWILELFVRGVLPIEPQDLMNLRNPETLENRQMYLIRGIKKDVNYFRRQKSRFEERNNFEKWAFMIGATCLPQDEFDNWILAVRPNMVRPLDRLFFDWVKTKAGKINDILEARTQLAKE